MMGSLPCKESALVKLMRGPSYVELLSMIINASTRHVMRFGKDTSVGNVPGPLMMCEAKGMKFAYLTLRTMAPGASLNCSLDIWFENKKVFSSRWNTDLLGEYEVITLEHGQWIHVLMMIDTGADVLQALTA